jgi:hypothetical protein
MKYLILVVAKVVFSINIQARKMNSNVHSKIVFTKSISAPTEKAAYGFHKRQPVLPEKAKQYLNQNYIGIKRDKLVKITSSANIVTYQIMVGKLDIIFDGEGNYVRSIQY